MPQPRPRRPWARRCYTAPRVSVPACQKNTSDRLACLAAKAVKLPFLCRQSTLMGGELPACLVEERVMPEAESSTPTKVPLTERLKALMLEYGSLALWVYLVIFVAVWAGFVLLISMGFHVNTHGKTAGTVFAAYLATKLTQPIRIGATLLLTPVVMKVLRLKKRSQSSETAPPE